VGGIGAGLVGPREERWFFEGYGPAAVDPLALAYYRHLRAVSDIGASGEHVFLAPQASTETKRAEADLVMRCFEPGNIVDLAREADQVAEERRAMLRL
jgi:spectinomycin phosphotransferase